VRSPRLREAFAVLLRDHQQPPPTLSADAERTIRRRVAARWAGGAAALVAITGLGTFAIMGALGSTTDENITMPSLAASPAPGLAVATFPFEGGPEFEVASSAYECGDPAPAPHPEDHDLQLTSAPYTGSSLEDPAHWASVSALKAVITKTTDADLGVVGTSGVDMLVVKDGIVVGMLSGDGPRLDLSKDTHDAYRDAFPGIADLTQCPTEDPRIAGQGVEPGTYQLIAVASVFSTPESVALSQALANGNAWNLTSRGLGYAPDALYLPGSYDCQNTLEMHEPARPCLADFSPNAAVDTEARTVSVVYHASDLVDEFATVLVSKPATVELVALATAGSAFGSVSVSDSLGSFDTLADLTCGTSAPGTDLASDAPASVTVAAQFDQYQVTTLVPGGTFGGTVMAGGIPDGSRVELLPGARLMYFKFTTVEVYSGEDFSSMAQISTVAGWAPVSFDGAITTDRYTGPQPAAFTAEAATMCPDVLSLGHGTIAVAGTWRITAPDGTVLMVDSSADAGYDQYGRKDLY